MRWAPGRRKAWIPLVVLGLLNVWGTTTLAYESALVLSPERDNTVMRELIPIVKEKAEGKPIWVMSTMVYPAFPLVNLTGAQWASRFCCVLVAPGVYTSEEKATSPFPYHPMDALSEMEQWQFDTVIEDLEARPPELIIVDAGSTKQAFGDAEFRFIPYFSQDPRFSRIFMKYRLLTRSGIFRVYERRPD